MESQTAVEQNQEEVRVTLSELQWEIKDAWWINDSVLRGDECHQATTMAGKHKKGQCE